MHCIFTNNNSSFFKNRSGQCNIATNGKLHSKEGYLIFLFIPLEKGQKIEKPA